MQQEEELTTDDPKRSHFLPISIIVAAILLAAGLWQESEKGRYTITTGVQEAHIPFLYDTKTGKVWRYYRNVDKETDKVTKEGFMVLFDPSKK